MFPWLQCVPGRAARVPPASPRVDDTAGQEGLPATVLLPGLYGRATTVKPAKYEHFIINPLQ